VIFGFFGGGSNNLIQGDFIGTNAAGTAAVGNSLDGVAIIGPNNTVGGTDGISYSGPCTGACNVVSGNGANGVQISSSAATGNLVQGDFIGVDVTGTVGVGNAANGVSLDSGAQDNTIGDYYPKSYNPGLYCLQNSRNGDTFIFNRETGKGVYTRCRDGKTFDWTGQIFDYHPYIAYKIG